MVVSIAGLAHGGQYFLGGGSGCAQECTSSTDYYTKTAPGDPVGRWDHRGVHVFGLVGDIHPTGKAGRQFEAMVDRNEDPHTGEPLGRRPQQFASVAERVAEFKRTHPHATPEQVADCEMRSAADQRHARNAWDVTFSLPKSWSVLHAAWLAAGEDEKAAKLIECAEGGIADAMDQFYEELAYVRRDVQGPPDPETGEVTAEHVAVDNLTMARFMHHQSREGDPQLHWHVMVLAKVRDDRDTWRKLFSLAFTKAKHMLDATFLRGAEARASRELGIPFVTRPDGISREVDGVSREVIDHFSTRARKLGPYADKLLAAWCVERGMVDEDGEPRLEAVPARIRWKVRQYANQKTRKSKLKAPPTLEQDLARFDRGLAEQTGKSLDEVRTLVEWGSVEGGIEPEPAEFDADDVIAQAVADLDRATESRSTLYHAISMRLPDMLGIEPARVRGLLTELTERALASPALVATAGRPRTPVPASLRDPRTGRSRYEPPTPVRFATRDLLGMEDALVAWLDHTGAPTVSAGTVSALLGDTKLGADQRATITGVLTSGRWLQTVNAPAGSGKSYMIGRLSEIARVTHGAPVTVFTISEMAAQVVRGEGAGAAHNVAGFLHHQARVDRGEPVSDVDRMRYTLPEGGIVVIDEASMMDTPQLTRLRGYLDRVDAQVVMVGDTAQLDAVDAGGAFAMLVEQAGRRDDLTTHELTTIRRFNEAWESDTSMRLRDGDVTALKEYQHRGRIKGDSDPDKVMDSAVAGFVQDHLAGKHSILVTGTDEEAAQANDRIRSRLVEVGHVDAFGVELHDHTQAGVGDIVQTRQNAKKIGVLNRQMWRVVGAHEWGGLDVQPATGRDPGTGERTWGAVQSIPASYVAGKVELAYAANVHAVQGDTTDTDHLLVSPSLGRSQLYPGSTRGRDGNWLYVVTEPSAELEAARAKVSALEHRFEHATVEGREELVPVLAGARGEVGEALSRAQTPAAKLASIVTTDDHQPAARVEIEREQRRQSSLGHLGPQWEAGVREARALTHREQIVAALGDEAGLVLGDRASTRLFTLLRSAELRGHDPAAALERAMHHGDGGWWSLSTVRSPASALYGRVEDQIGGHRADRPIPGTFENRVPAASLGGRNNENLDYTRAVGRDIDDVIGELAHAQAADPEPWALRALGPVPDDPIARGGWIGRVAHATAYRHRYGITDQRTVLGARPRAEREPERAWLWDMGARMVGMPDHDRDLAGQSRGELLNRVQDWERALTAMPRNVDAELGPAHDALRRAEGRVIELRTAGGDTGTAEADREVYRENVRVLEEIAHVRTLAYEDATELRVRAEDARTELDHRDELDHVRSGEPLPPEPDFDPEFDIDPFEVEPGRDVEAADVDLAVHRTVFERLTRGVGDEPVPAFGSYEWVALGDDDPRKELAVTQAAVAYDRLGDPVDAERAELVERRDEVEAVTGMRVGEELDVEHLAAVHGWVSARQAEVSTPRYASGAWVDADEAGKLAGEAQAALGWWNLGEPVGELRERVAAAEDREAVAQVSAAWAERGDAHGWDQRSYAQVERDRGIDPDPVNVAAEGARWSGEPLAAAEPEPAPQDQEHEGTVEPDHAVEQPVGDGGLEPVEGVDEAGQEVDHDREPLAAGPVHEELELAVNEETTTPEIGELEPVAEPTEPESEAIEGVEPEVDDVERRFQDGLEWSLGRARVTAEPEPELDEPEPEVEPEPEWGVEPEPEPDRPVPAVEDPDLSEQREVAARAYDALRDREPEPVAEPEPSMSEPAVSEPAWEPVVDVPAPVGDDLGDAY